MARNRASAKKAGSSFERLVADYLAATVDDRIDRRVKNGNRDLGDIGGVRLPDGGKVVVECKNVATVSLPAWLREAEVERQNDLAKIGVVVHKRRGTTVPGEQFVTMTLDTLVVLLGGTPNIAGTVENPLSEQHSDM